MLKFFLFTATKEDRMSTTRLESDSMGTIEVPADKYWGAQTERSCTFQYRV